MISTEDLIASIYDCAADPEHWPVTLSQICTTTQAAYCLIGFADIAPDGMASRMIQIHSPWDTTWIRKAREMFPKIPGVENYFRMEADQGWNQMSYMPEEAFRETEIYQDFCKPQGLRDCLNLNIIKRPSQICGMALASSDGRELFGPDELKLVEALSPHIRRAIAINNIVDKEQLALRLFKRMLDHLQSAVFLVGHGHKIEYANEAGEKMLREGKLLCAVSGKLAAGRKAGTSLKLQAALDRAAGGDEAAGISGIGVPLIGTDDSRGAAYVLPLGKSDARNELGYGHCAVFVSRRDEQMPVMEEILRTLYDLSPNEAKVATLISSGEKAAGIAASMEVAVSTVRTHIKSTFRKCGISDQTSLASLVKNLAPPV